MSLQDWLRNGWVVAQAPSAEEVRELLALADRDIRDAQTKGLSADWRLNIAYNAALQLATAALAAEGFRAAKEAHHYRAVQSLAHTIGADANTVAQMDLFRKKRNLAEYERAGAASNQEAAEMLGLARNLRSTIRMWLKTKHPEFQ